MISKPRSKTSNDSLVNFDAINVLGEKLETAKVSQAKAQAENERLERIMSATAGVFYACKPLEEFEFTFLSPNVSVFGYDSDEVIRTPGWWKSLIHPQDRNQAIDNLKNTGSSNIKRFDYRFLKHEGTYIWIRNECTLLRDSNGNPKEIVGFLRDVTDEVLTKIQLEVLSSSVDKAAIIARTDAKGKIIFVNDNFCEISGYGREELINRDHRILNSKFHDKSFFKQMWETISSGSSWTGEIRNQRKNGTYYWVYTKIFPIVDSIGGDRQYLAIRFDISEEKNAQARLVSQEKMATLGFMAGSIAHEINNPLSIIHLKAQLLQDGVVNGKLDPNFVRVIAEEIEATALRISKIVKGLRSFARDGESDPFEEKSVRALVEETVSFCEFRFKNQNVRLIVGEIDPAISIKCRSSQISQVLLNLLGNSLDVTQGHAEKWIQIDVLENQGFVEISVTDSGSGIPHDVQKNLMQPFFTTKPLGQGTGLGLSVSKGIVSVHHGQLFLDTASKNTRFVIRLPSSESVKR
jgi:PAS domain S-box-containing protein